MSTQYRWLISDYNNFGFVSLDSTWCSFLCTASFKKYTLINKTIGHMSGNRDVLQYRGHLFHDVRVDKIF